MASRFVRNASWSQFLFVLVLVLVVWAFGSAALAQRKGTVPKQRKVDAEKVQVAHERQEERVRERARKIADNTAKPAPDSGKRVPRLESDTVKRQPRAPFGWEADDLTNYERGDLYDKPREAARFFRHKRLPMDADGKFTMKDLPLERYFAAQDQMREMPLFASARNTTRSITGFKPSRKRVGGAGASCKWLSNTADVLVLLKGTCPVSIS